MDQTKVPVLHIPVSILCLKSCTEGPLVGVGGLSGSNNTRAVKAISRDVDYVLTMNDMWAVMLTLIANLAVHRCWPLNYPTGGFVCDLDSLVFRLPGIWALKDDSNGLYFKRLNASYELC